MEGDFATDMADESSDSSDAEAQDVNVDVQTDLQLETELQVQEAGDAIHMVEGLDSATWSSLDADRRLEVLQQIEDQMAGIQGRPPVPVTQELMDASTFGGFDGHGIVLNAAHLESEMPVDEFIDTMVHEGRHAYQVYAIEHPEFVADEETVASWATNRAIIPHL